MVSTFHRRAPPDLQFTKFYQLNPSVSLKGPMTATCSSDYPAIYRGLQLRLTIANDLSLAIESSMIDRKVTLMQLGHQFNSYNLMHIQES
jgi:hypothetical protein